MRKNAYNAVLNVVHKHRQKFAMYCLFVVFLVLLRSAATTIPAPIPKALAADITLGCGYADNFLYVGDDCYYNPRVISEGPQRIGIMGLPTIPEYVIISHQVGLFSRSTVKLVTLQSIRCISKLLKNTS